VNQIPIMCLRVNHQETSLPRPAFAARRVQANCFTCGEPVWLDPAVVPTNGDVWPTCVECSKAQFKQVLRRVQDQTA
jgi:hypothetical protein